MAECIGVRGECPQAELSYFEEEHPQQVPLTARLHSCGVLNIDL